MGDLLVQDAALAHFQQLGGDFTFSTVGRWFEVDAACYQDVFSATLFPSLNHDKTKPHALWDWAATLKRLKMNPTSHCSLASVMVKPSLMQYGLGL